MGVFEFIIILVLISTLGKVAIGVGGPLMEHVGDLVREIAAERKARREALESGVRLDDVVVEELEGRLLRIEERLDFIEELRAAPRRPSLGPPATREEMGEGAPE